MKRLLIAISAVFFTSAFVVDVAEARRLGGAKSSGAQRQGLPDKPATPAAQQAAPAAAPAAAAGAVARKPMSPWMGALAGLAAGLGLAWLLGDQLGSVVMAILLALAAVVVVGLVARAFMKPRAQASPGGLQYAGVGNETVAAPPPSQSGGGVAVPSFQSQFTPKVPADFNADAFLREAKKSFLALQAANDRGNLASIRELVTDEMYQSLKQDVDERRGARQRTDVLNLDANLLELVTESGMHWASIRFSGLIREEEGQAPQHFEEIWNLQKPEAGDAGWMLAGIQNAS
jgi:predicted lipid-binding transport protein (Tim44 family)